MHRLPLYLMMFDVCDLLTSMYMLSVVAVGQSAASDRPGTKCS
jgi:hypothetical protein